MARALVSDLGVIFAIKLNGFLTNLFPSISKAIERLLREKALPQPGIQMERSSKCKKCGDKGGAQVVP